MKTKILDCTLRDGGYYTNWDFDHQIVDTYLDAVNKLPIDYIEVGYRNLPSEEYMGEYGYCPVYVLKHIRETTTKKVAVMLNEKSTQPSDLDNLLSPIVGLADMIRIAINPSNFDRAIVLAKAVKSMGFEVGFNTMYMSKWKDMNFYNELYKLEGVADLFCMVDSFGGVSPHDVKETIDIIRNSVNCPIGFHGHNNLEMGLVNTVTAIEKECDFVDATILGMGRGAGNLKMELLLTYMNKNYNLDVDFNVLGNVISAFTPLYNKYQWGTNLPYMLAGANSFPQKEVMSMVTNRVYSFNSIVRSLENRKSNIEDNAKFPVLDAKHYEKVIIIGGGAMAYEHLQGIKVFINQHKNHCALIFATCRNAMYYTDIDVDKYFCLVGNEVKRLKSNVGILDKNDKCILPPYPRVLGTDVYDEYASKTYELQKIAFTEDYQDSCTTVALQTAMNMSDNLFIIGYDGYPNGYLSDKERELTLENRTIFSCAEKFLNHKLVSLTPTLYNELKTESLYQYIK